MHDSNAPGTGKEKRSHQQNCTNEPNEYKNPFTSGPMKNLAHGYLLYPSKATNAGYSVGSASSILR